jgi:HAD superfamily hydrolase (TIGR01509 family)
MTSFQRRNVILFDHDGTVVDSEIVALKSAWHLTVEIAQQFPGAKHYDLQDFIQCFAGKPYREILAQVYSDAPAALSEADIVRLVTEEEERAIAQLKKEAKPTEGTVSVLSQLREQGFQFALVSNSSLRRLTACLTAAGLTEYFPSQLVFSAQNSLPKRRPKPLPDIYLHAARALNAQTAWCIAIEDSTSGVKSAIAAKIPLVLGYVGGTHIRESERSDRAAALTLAGVHHIIEQMPALIPLLSKAEINLGVSHY